MAQKNSRQNGKKGEGSKGEKPGRPEPLVERDAQGATNPNGDIKGGKAVIANIFDGMTEEKKAAIARILDVMGDGALPVLEEAFKADVDDALIGDGFIDLLGEMLKGGDPALKADISGILSWIGDGRCVAPLVEAIRAERKEHDPDKRIYFDRLAEMGDLAISALQELARDEDKEVRTEALIRLIRVGDSAAPSLALEFFHGKDDKHFERVFEELIVQIQNWRWEGENTERLLRGYREYPRRHSKQAAVALLCLVNKKQALSAFKKDTMHIDPLIQEMAVYGILETDPGWEGADYPKLIVDSVKALVARAGSRDIEEAQRAIRGLGLFVVLAESRNEKAFVKVITPEVTEFLESMVENPNQVSRVIVSATTCTLLDIKRGEFARELGGE